MLGAPIRGPAIAGVDFIISVLTIIDNSYSFKRVKIHHIKQSLAGDPIRWSDGHGVLVGCVVFNGVHLKQRDLEKGTQGESFVVFARQVNDRYNM